MNKSKKKKLKRQRAMLKKIAALVDEFRCDDESALDAVKFLKDDWDSEQRWACHYHDKLIEARTAGYLPDNFDF